MPFENQATLDGQGIRTAYSGRVDKSDLAASSEEILTDEALAGRLRYSIVDLSACDEVAVSAEDLEDIMAADLEIIRRNPGIVVAVVAPTDLLYGMARVWEVYAEEEDVHVLVARSRKEAAAWLTDTVRRVHRVDVTIGGR